MENEKKLPTAAQELPDEEMDKVVGGTNKHVELIQREPHWNGSGIPVFWVDGVSADRDLSPRYQIQISRGIYAESLPQCYLYGGTAVRNSCIF